MYIPCVQIVKSNIKQQTKRDQTTCTSNIVNSIQQQVMKLTTKCI